jgi:uncharacterized protein YjbI with pentapeptide repeats
LTGANLTGAITKDSQFMGANLTNAVFKSASMTNVQMSRTQATGADFSGAMLESAMLSRSVFAKANFSNATGNWDRASFKGSKFIGTVNTHNCVSWPTMVNADMSSSDFTKAFLRGLTVTGTKFGGAIWSETM